VHEHPNAAVVRRAYEAITRGERAAALAFVAPDVLDDLVAALQPRDVAGAFQTRTIVPLALAAAGDLVVAIDHVCARRGGRPLDVEGIVVFSFDVERRIAAVKRLNAKLPSRGARG
jgi:hypothetical protein